MTQNDNEQIIPQFLQLHIAPLGLFEVSHWEQEPDQNNRIKMKQYMFLFVVFWSELNKPSYTCDGIQLWLQNIFFSPYGRFCELLVNVKTCQHVASDDTVSSG